MYRNYNFLFVLLMKINPLSKVGYYSKIAEIFNTALTAQSAQEQQKYKIHLSFLQYVLGIYNFERNMPW